MRRIAFIEKLQGRQSLLCVGLDPRPNTNDNSTGADGLDPKDAARQILAQNKKIIEATSDLAACYKPNIAFYECYGAAGLDALEETIAHIPEAVPVILDAKRGDIGDTAQAYARAVFERFRADAVTLSPYMGLESVAPFLRTHGAFVFVLVRTSNASSDAVQALRLEDGALLYERVAEESSSWAGADKVGFVVGATEPQALSTIRVAHPERIILSPGIGAQGADMGACVSFGCDARGGGILPVVSRGIAAAEDPRAAAQNYAAAARTAAQEKIKSAALSSKATKPSASTHQHKNKEQIIDGLFAHECVKIGDFVLKSGAHSPFYIDLRRIISFPALFRMVTRAYAELAAPLSFDLVAGIPTAALPFASALAYEKNIPMIYPRIPKKPHGTGNDIEGAFAAGRRALLLDDLITHGTSKEEAVDILRAAGLVVRDLAVLIRRSKNADDEMRRLGITLHYALDIEDIIARGRARGFIDAQAAEKIAAFLRG